MKTNDKTTKANRPMGAALLAAAIGAVLLLNGCAGGGNTGATSTTTWPPATPPATSQTNTYVGTQSPGWYTVTIDHTNNSFSYQNLSLATAAVSGTFTTTANGFLALSSGGYALEQLSRAVLLVPPLEDSGFERVSLTSAPIFAIVSPACQTIPSRTQFEYIAATNPNYSGVSGALIEGDQAIDEHLVGSGLLSAESTNNGQNWEFGGELQYLLPNAAENIPDVSYSPTPDPFNATCAAGNAGSSLIQTAIAVPSSLAANFAIGPTGLFVEDRYQSDGVAFLGAFEPLSPVDLSQLIGATFLGVNAVGGVGTGDVPSVSAPELVAFSAAADASGTSLELTGGAFPSNDPTQSSAANYTLNLGAQDPVNNGYFPSATVTSACSNCTGVPQPAYALVTNAGGKYAIFLEVADGAGEESGFLLFQQ